MSKRHVIMEWYVLKDKHEHTTNVPSRLFIGKQLYNLLSDASLCKLWRNRLTKQKFKLKYLINKTLQHKSIKEVVFQFQILLYIMQ